MLCCRSAFENAITNCIATNKRSKTLSKQYDRDEMFELDLAIDELEDKNMPMGGACATSCSCKCTTTSCVIWEISSDDEVSEVNKLGG